MGSAAPHCAWKPLPTPGKGEAKARWWGGWMCGQMWLCTIVETGKRVAVMGGRKGVTERAAAGGGRAGGGVQRGESSTARWGHVRLVPSFLPSKKRPFPTRKPSPRSSFSVCAPSRKPSERNEAGTLSKRGGKSKFGDFQKKQGKDRDTRSENPPSGTPPAGLKTEVLQI
jgi:hypothetical protein